MDWEHIITEGQRLADLMPRERIDSSEAEKALEYYKATGYNDDKLATFLNLMVTEPHRRSKRTQRYRENLRKVLLNDWSTPLTGKEKAMAWGWAMRIVKSASFLTQPGL